MVAGGFHRDHFQLPVYSRCFALMNERDIKVTVESIFIT